MLFWLGNEMASVVAPNDMIASGGSISFLTQRAIKVTAHCLSVAHSMSTCSGAATETSLSVIRLKMK